MYRHEHILLNDPGYHPIACSRRWTVPLINHCAKAGSRHSG
jgi:hypothetical protein